MRFPSGDANLNSRCRVVFESRQTTRPFGRNRAVTYRTTASGDSAACTVKSMPQAWSMDFAGPNTATSSWEGDLCMTD